jgi:hypothetical protein
MSENAIDSDNISKLAPDTAKPKGARKSVKKPFASNVIDTIAKAVELDNRITNQGDIALGEFAGNIGIEFGQILTGQLGGLDYTMIGGLLSPMCDRRKP